MSDVIETLGKTEAGAVFRFIADSGPVRYSDIESHVDASPATVSNRLKELADIGAITRTQYDEIPPRVEYEMTPAGRELLGHLDNLASWQPDATLAADGGAIESAERAQEMCTVNGLREAADAVSRVRGEAHPMVDAKLADYESDLLTLAELLEDDADAPDIVSSPKAADRLHAVGPWQGARQ